MATYHFSNNPHPTIRGTNQKINTVSHFRYITREGSYSHGNGREQDLLHVAHGNIPEWAESAKDFWKAAEDNRRANGRAYREIRMALPEELSLQENIKLVEEFLDKSGIRDNHAYTYAIHDKAAAFDENHRNIHCHLMFNERIIEKDRPIDTPEQFFSRYSVKLGNRTTGEGAGEITGGYKASTVYSDKNTTIKLRKDWENIVNNGLERNNIDARVSCETLEKQREALEKKGKHMEAEFLNRNAAPRLQYGYKRPFVMKKIRERIDFYKKTLENGEAEPDGQTNTQTADNVIDLFARDVALRQKARELQREQSLAVKANKEIAGKEYEESFKTDPMVVTVGDLRKSFHDTQTKLLSETETLTAQYESLKGSIIPEKYIETIALNYVTNGRYTESQTEYNEVSKKLRDEQGKEESVIHDSNLYMAYLKNMKELRTQRSDLWNEHQEYNKLKGTDELKSVMDDITSFNEQQDEEASKLYKKISMNEKRLEATDEALKNLQGLPDEHIAYGERLPSVLTRHNKLDGVTPLKDMPSLTYKGQVYIIIGETDDGKPKGVKLYDEVKDGQVPVYKFNRQEKDGKMRTTGIEKTEENARVYKKYSQRSGGGKGGSREEKTSEGLREHTAANRAMINEKSESTIDKIMNANVRIPPKRVHPEDERELSEGEKEVEDMFKKWNQQLRQANVFRGKRAILKRIEKEHNK